LRTAGTAWSIQKRKKKGGKREIGPDKAGRKKESKCKERSKLKTGGKKKTFIMPEKGRPGPYGGKTLSRTGRIVQERRTNWENTKACRAKNSPIHMEGSRAGASGGMNA